jgi:ankyrin repeat protein
MAAMPPAPPSMPRAPDGAPAGGRGRPPPRPPAAAPSAGRPLPAGLASAESDNAALRRARVAQAATASARETPPGSPRDEGEPTPVAAAVPPAIAAARARKQLADAQEKRAAAIASRMESEVARPMVRDITAAELPTRMGLRAKRLPPAHAAADALDADASARALPPSCEPAAAADDDDDDDDADDAARRGLGRGPGDGGAQVLGARARPREPAGAAELQRAIAAGAVGEMEALVGARRELLDCRFANGDTPLHAALAAGGSGGGGMLRRLLELGADPNGESAEQAAPLALGAAAGDARAVEVLLAHGARPDPRGAVGDSALHGAAAGGHAHVVALLLEANASPLVRGPDGCLPYERVPPRHAQLRKLLAEAAGVRGGRAEEAAAVEAPVKPAAVVPAPPLPAAAASASGSGSGSEAGSEAGGEASTAAGAAGADAAAARDDDDDGDDDDEEADGPAPNAAAPYAAQAASRSPAAAAAAASAAARPSALVEGSGLAQSPGPGSGSVQSSGLVEIFLAAAYRRHDHAHLLAALQAVYGTTETSFARILCHAQSGGALAGGAPAARRPAQVLCDVQRTSAHPLEYRLCVRLPGVPVEHCPALVARRERKGRFGNSHYYIFLVDVLAETERRRAPAAGLPDDARLFLGKVRSLGFGGGDFAVYDNGFKPSGGGGGADGGGGGGGRGVGGREKGKGFEVTYGEAARKEVGAIVYNRNSSRRQPMAMRVLAPVPRTPPPPLTADSLRAAIDGGDSAASVPAGAQLLKLTPPRWNEIGKVYQLAFEGRAACMSNKNVQLESTYQPGKPMLQVGKLAEHVFNVDHGLELSTFLGFAVALTVFEQSSHWRQWML